jgi:myo-inositol-1-phosphate synthase
MKLEVWDSPNSAGVVIDAVRCCKLALDNKLSGSLNGPSSYFKKSPPVQYTDEEARKLTEEFITRYGWKKEAARTTTTSTKRAKKTAKTVSISRKTVPAMAAKGIGRPRPKRIVRKKK